MVQVDPSPTEATPIGPRAPVVNVVAPRVVCLVYLDAHTTPALARQAVRHIREAGADWPTFSLLVDASALELPDSETRRAGRDELAKLDGKLDRVALVIGGNTLLRAAARFVFRFRPMDVQIYPDMDAALAALTVSEASNSSGSPP